MCVELEKCLWYALVMRPAKIAKFECGDIVHHLPTDFYYLVLMVNMSEGEQYYETINLELGTHEMLGYWEYLGSHHWKKVA